MIPPFEPFCRSIEVCWFGLQVFYRTLEIIACMCVDNLADGLVDALQGLM